MIDPAKVSAVIVTRGDADLSQILETLEGFGEVIVWDNSKKLADLKVAGRYFAAFNALSEHIYVQDDDCVTDPRALCAAYDPEEGKVLCNMTPAHAVAPYYQWRIKLVGFGAVFPKRLIDFRRYLGRHPLDGLFMLECDRVFTALNDCEVIQIPIRHLDNASDGKRLWQQSDHGWRMVTIRERMEIICEGQ